jgi:hypothetical protein
LTNTTGTTTNYWNAKIKVSSSQIIAPKLPSSYHSELRKKRESGAQYNKNYQYDFEQYGKKNY